MKLLFIGYIVGIMTAGICVVIEDILDKRKKAKQRRFNQNISYIDYKKIKKELR